MDDQDLDPTLRRAVEELRRPVRFDPGFDARVLAGIRRPARPALLDWLLRPRLSPLGGLILAGAAAAGAIILTRPAPVATPTVVPVSATGATAATGRQVQFVLAARGAQHVTLVGDFNDWDPSATPLRAVPGPDGLWSVQVPLAPGRHEYAFVVDGRRWLADPSAPRSTDDDFGTPNSVVTVS